MNRVIYQKTRRECRTEALCKLAYYTLNPLWMLAALWALLVFGLSL